MLILGILFQYGVQFQMVTDIMVLKILNSHDFSTFLMIFAYLLVFSQKILLFYEFFYLMNLLIESRL